MSRAPDWIERPACRYCAQVTQARAGSFYRGLRLLPEPRRTAMYVIYAWMREADDLVDAAADADSASAALGAFAHATDTLFDAGETGGAPLLEALKLVHERFDLPREPFDEMIEGQRRDLDPAAVETAAELNRYCELVASSVGVLCVHIWGCRGAEAAEFARQRGIAFQLTNILRDVGEDLQQGRCYLPREDLVGPLDRDGLAAWNPARECSALILKWCAMARTFYADSAPLEGLVPRECRGTLVAMTSVYRGILGQIERRPARSVLGPRARLSRLRMMALAGRAFLVKR